MNAEYPRKMMCAVLCATACGKQCFPAARTACRKQWHTNCRQEIPSFQRSVIATIAALAMLLLAAAAQAQPVAPQESGAGGNLASHSQATLRPLPTALLVSLRLVGEEKSAEAAIVQLKKRQQAARAQFEKLGAAPMSIRFGKASIAQDDAGEQRRLQAMIRQRVRGGKAKEPPSAAKTLTVACTITAEFPLPAGDADAALLAAERVKAQIKAAKLSGVSTEEKAEEDDSSEDAAFGNPYDRAAQDPNAPAVMFLARLSKQDKAKAAAESFQKAREKAASWAKAAGIEFGGLADVAHSLQPSRDASPQPRYYPSAPSRWRPYAGQGESDEDEQSVGDGESSDPLGESMAADLNQISFQISTQAQFRVGPEKKTDRGNAVRSIVMGNGVVAIRRPPTLLRMYLMLQGRGKNAEEAMARLQERRAAAVVELEKLGADSKAMDLGRPAISQEEAQRRAQLEQAIRQKMRSTAKAGRKIKLPEVVALTSLLTAEWPLPAKPAEELFLWSQKLQAQVKAARLATGKEADAQSEEEKELAEEMGADSDTRGADPAAANAPHCVYVAHISPEQRAAAQAQAVQKAKADAERMARAAGAPLGSLVDVNPHRFDEIESAFHAYGANAYDPSGADEFLQRQQTQLRRPDEAVAENPAGTVFRVSVAATFAKAPEGAAAASAGRVSGDGAAVVQKFPTRMRLKMSLAAKAKDLDATLAELHKRRDAAFAELVKLGAAKESLKLDTPQALGDQSARMGRAYPPPAIRPGAAKRPQSVTLLAGLSAEWPVEANSAEALLAAAHQLSEKIAAAKIAGGGPAAKPAAGGETPEDADEASPVEPDDPFGAQAAAAAAMQADVSVANFSFSATITDAEAQKTLGQAVEKAKADALRVAESAGAKLGPMVNLTGSLDSGVLRYGGYSPPYRRYAMPADPGPSDDASDKPNEGQVHEPGPVKFNFSAHATYLLDRAK